MTLTGRLAFEHIECNVTSSAMTTKVYLDLVKAAKWKWISAIFQEMKCDQLSAAVVKSDMIDDAFIILCVQHAFMQSAHDKEHIGSMNVGWSTADNAFETVQGTVAHQATPFRRFQDYYNRRLNKLFENGDKVAKHQ